MKKELFITMIKKGEIRNLAKKKKNAMHYLEHEHMPTVSLLQI